MSMARRVVRFQGINTELNLILSPFETFDNHNCHYEYIITYSCIFSVVWLSLHMYSAIIYLLQLNYQNLHWKLGQQTPSVGTLLAYLETTAYSRLWNKSSRPFQLNQTTDRKNENKNCLNELNKLKFCEVSRYSFSNRC